MLLKHVGMLAGAEVLGAGREGYHLAEHPIQRRVRRVMEYPCHLDMDEVRWTIDGSSLPAPAVPLRNMASMYAGFAQAVDQQAVDLQDPGRTKDQACIFNAMTHYPEMVGSEGPLCTVLTESFQEVLIGKLGADGCYAIGIRESEQTRNLGAEGAVGITVKIEDGSIDILYSAVCEILEQLRVGTKEM